MPWKVDIEKFINGEYWSNVYYVDTETMILASGVAREIVNAEETVTNDNVQFTKYRVSDTDPETELFMTVVLNEAGERHSTVDLLPLWNVVRVDLTAEAGRPSRKYLRGILSEADIAYVNINSLVVAEIDVGYCQALEAIEELVDIDTQPFTAVNVKPNVGMRQLRRGSKRRTLPIIP